MLYHTTQVEQWDVSQFWTLMELTNEPKTNIPRKVALNLLCSNTFGCF